MQIDLHTHSNASDGTEPPGEVMASATAAGLDVVALTDHDTTSGWVQAEASARRLGICFVPGIEISCVHRGISIHLLGYLQDPADAALLAEVTRARTSREVRARRMVDLLSADLPLTYDEVLLQTQAGTTIGRPHIADALVAKGIVATRGEAFTRYLAAGGPYHVSHYAPDPVHAVELVVAAGGVAVMAHPFAHTRGRVVADGVIEQMAVAGLGGLEAHHRDHDAAAVQHAVDLAGRLGLFVTGSSDYHGTGKANRLGEHTTAPEVLDQMEQMATGTAIVRP